MAMILDYRVTNGALDVAPVAALTQTMRAGMEWAALPAANQAATLRVRTARFGLLEVEADLLITLPGGLIGFENCRRFVVVRGDERTAFRWLQSVEQAHVAFPIIEPGEFRPDYAPTISDNDAQTLGLDGSLPALIFCIVTIPTENPRAMTANLLGPLVINPLTRQGRQVIVQDDGFTTRHRLMDELARTARIARGESPDLPTSAAAANLSGQGRNVAYGRGRPALRKSGAAANSRRPA